MSRIANFFKNVYAAKYYILTFIVFFFIFFRVYFPDNLLVLFVFNNISKQTGYVVDYDDASVNFFPKVGMEVSTLKLYNSKKQQFILTDSELSVPLLSLLFFSPELTFKTNVLGGKINGYFSDIPIVLSNDSSLLINLVVDKLNLAKILAMYIPAYLNIELRGILSGSVSGELVPLKPDTSKLNIDLAIAKIHFFPTKIFNVDIPEIKLARGVLQGAVLKSVFNINKLVLGSKKEDLFIKVTGKLALKYNKPYDLRVVAHAKGKIKDLLDLTLLSLGAKEKKGVFTFRMTGDTRNPIPQIKPE